ncbi:MAG: hypothetical protein H6Q17_1603 [Bacteroidetes bacterium]|jgi:hypothetical protein|nr:hypothetical protein [Bacteroidota bacterium]
MKFHLTFKMWLIVTFLSAQTCLFAAINRQALVTRNNPVVHSFDSLSSLSVGNGNFAFTVDASGLQTFPELYKSGVSLGTQSQWGWHSFANPNNYRFEETLKNYNLHGWNEPYSTEFKEGRQKEAAEWFRANPHRLHLGVVGLELANPTGQKTTVSDFTNINQTLDLWTGNVHSAYSVFGKSVDVQTVCHPADDMISVSVTSSLIRSGNLKFNFRFPYPSGQHTDDACNWLHPEAYSTSIVEVGAGYAVICCRLDATIYFVRLQWKGEASLKETQDHYYVLAPENTDAFSFSCAFTNKKPEHDLKNFEETRIASATYWNGFWSKGAAVDFSQCKDSRAKELERRVVLSQYLMAIQCAGDVPPQETGLTYNSWFGKFHLEMHWWHAVHFALWNRIDLLEKSMAWYNKAYDNAKKIAERQGFKGVRWMKMTDPSAIEAPSKVGSFLIWQQPHFIYMAELIYRDHPSKAVIEKYKKLVFETADFMASFATYDKAKNRYVLKGAIPAQETLRAAETTNPPFELSYWHYALSVAQQWRVRAGLPENKEWNKILKLLSPLAQKDGLYLAAETAPETYHDVRFTSDHMAVLGALGIFPQSRLVKPEIMKHTLDWVWKNWNWDKTWGWDYPMTAMDAARLGDGEKAVGALLMNKRTNTYLINGHNYQDERLRIYLPGNGGLLTAVAMMCAGWDGSKGNNPGFPKDGNWNVVWEGLKKMP